MTRPRPSLMGAARVSMETHDAMNAPRGPLLVIFAAPVFSETAVRFIDALRALPDVRVGVVGQEPEERLPGPVRAGLAGHWRVSDVLDAGQLAWAVQGLANHAGLPVHRLLGVYEQLQEPLATVREQAGIDGMGIEAARNFRDKSRMKAVLRAAAVPCARFALVASEQEGHRFAAEVGHAVVFKPPAGAGALSTFRVDGEAAVGEALRRTAPTHDRPVLLEEYITGDEHSLETVSIDGRAVWHSLTHYLPTPLEVLDNPWIQWCLVLPREVDAPHYDDIRGVAGRALDALGMVTGLTHMEWFRRRDGSIAISEVAARPPGAQIMTVVSRAHGMDFHHAWARLMVHGEFDPPARRYAAGAAFLRGQGRGVVKAIRGLDAVGRDVGALIVDAKLPSAGQQPSGSYEGEGYVIVRHPETGVVVDALKKLITAVRVELG